MHLISGEYINFHFNRLIKLKYNISLKLHVEFFYHFYYIKSCFVEKGLKYEEKRILHRQTHVECSTKYKQQISTSFSKERHNLKIKILIMFINFAIMCIKVCAALNSYVFHVCWILFFDYKNLSNKRKNRFY